MPRREPKPQPPPSTPRERILAKRAHIHEQLKAVTAGVPFVPVGPGGADQDTTKTVLHRRLVLTYRLVNLTEDELGARAHRLIAKLTADHQRIWLAERLGLPLQQEDPGKVWAEPADFTARVELDLVLIALGKEP